MKPALSLYLDAVRFAAAMTVYFGHLALANDPPFVSAGFSATFAGLASCIDEAVIVFFVLSGFVIAHATAGREPSPAGYATARLARIYSVALPALAATLLLDTVGRMIAPGHYPPFAPEPFLGAAFFLNQLWYVDAGAGSNGPYWSLNYEFWYYVLFGLILFLRGTPRLVAVAATLLLCGPQISVYFLLWLTGVALHRLTQRVAVSEAAGLALFLAGPLVMGLAIVYGVPGEAWMLDRLAWILRDSNILHDSVIALAFAAHLWGGHAIAGRLGGDMGWVERPIRWLAGSTFTIYLFHMPLSRFLAALLPEPPGVWSGPLLLALGLPILFAIAAVTERRKQPWVRLFGTVFAQLGAGQRRARLG